MAHVHTFGVVAPAAAGIIQSVSLTQPSIAVVNIVLVVQSWGNVMLCYRVSPIRFSPPMTYVTTPTTSVVFLAMQISYFSVKLSPSSFQKSPW